MKKYFGIFISLFLFSCGNNHSYTLHSPDKKQSITIINSGDIRYIIDGYYGSVPETNYVKVDLSSTPMRNYGTIVGCWRTDKYEWHIIDEGVTILENKLDSKRLKFGTKFPEDKNGIPTIIDFSEPNCFELGFEYNKILNKSGDVVVE